MNPLEIPGQREPRLLEALESGWNAAVARGGIAYDPREGETFRAEPFTYYHVPGRSSRPAPAASAPSQGLLKPHAPCPFEEPGLLDIREVLRFRRAGRTYHIITNKYPIKRLHHLCLRSSDAPGELLPQCIFGADEIEDMLLLCRAIGPPMRFFFNSNAGADGSHSGSTVNHWHFQLFPDRGDVFDRGSGPSTGRIPGWHVPHRLHCGADLGAVATRVWEDVRVAIRRDCAFTLAIQPGEGESLQVALFARAPIEPVEIDGVGTLSSRFGGFELTGAVVLYSAAVLDWVRAHPGRAEELAWTRLRDATRDLW